MKTKIGKEVAHVTRDLNTTFKVKRSRSPGRRFTHCHVNTSDCRNVLAAGNYCYVAVCSVARGDLAPTEEGEGRGHIMAAARLQLFIIIINVNLQLKECSFTNIPLLCERSQQFLQDGLMCLHKTRNYCQTTVIKARLSTHLQHCIVIR